MSAGVVQVMTSASQAAASVITASAQTIQSGFFAVLSALSPTSQSSVGTSGGTVSFTPPSGPVTVTIPGGAFSGPVTVTLSAPTSFPASRGSAAALTGTGVGVEITLSQDVQPLVPAKLSVSYQPSDVVGVNQNTLILARYDTTDGVWVPLVSSVDTITDVVTAQTNHFSLFQIMESAPSTSVGSVQIACNPLRPNCFPMVFESLPANARLRIYTLAGTLVKDINSDASGAATWDGTNRSQATVASGVYVIYAQGNGTTKSIKVAVER
ncbi:MAG: hypothetical protein ACHQ49_12755 [Elusimicrobiota bacterium]